MARWINDLVRFSRVGPLCGSAIGSDLWFHGSNWHRIGHSVPPMVAMDSHRECDRSLSTVVIRIPQSRRRRLRKLGDLVAPNGGLRLTKRSPFVRSAGLRLFNGQMTG